MYNDDRSDFAAPIVGFLYTAFVAIMFGVLYFCGGAEIFEENLGITTSSYIGVAGFVIAGFNLYKAYIPEGVTFALVGMMVFAVQSVFSFPAAASLGMAIALLVLFAVAGVISFLRGYIDLLIINSALGVASFFLVGWTGPKAVFIIGGIVAIIAAGIALYVAFCDWSFAQDVIEDIEDDFCCDDDCCCEEHGEDCDCEECKPVESAEAEVVEETEPAAEETKE